MEKAAKLKKDLGLDSLHYIVLELVELMLEMEVTEGLNQVVYWTSPNAWEIIQRNILLEEKLD